MAPEHRLRSDQGILCVHIVVVVWISGLVSDGICNVCRIIM